jgi:hypothetical protein
MRDPFSLLALGGVYLASAGLPAHKRLLDALGFEQVAGTARTS